VNLFREMEVEMVGLVELAQRYVSLSAELEETRNAMRAALMDGPDVNPTKAESSGPPDKGMDREAILAQSKAADERVLTLLREKPMRPSEIAKATRGKLSTTRERLRRLHKRGVVEPAADGWRLAETSPTTPPSL
jgi:Bacterial regulatory protein, arsR family